MKKNPITNLRKLFSASLVAAPALMLPASAWAAPVSTLPDVTSGNLTVSNGSTIATQSTLNTLNISVTNGATNTILTWGAFSIQASDTVNFNLSNASSAVLNRVTGGAATDIYGGLISNGKVFILNPAGITIYNGAQINVGSFYASTINDTDAVSAFQAGSNLSYTGATAGNLAVESGAQIKTLTSTGTVLLAGTNLTVNGYVDGNLTVQSLHTGSNINLAYNGDLHVTGTLTAKTYGGSVYFGEAGTTTIDGKGASTISTAGNLQNGSVDQWMPVVFTGTGASLTIDAKGAYNLSQGHVNLGNSSNQLPTVNANASWVNLESSTDLNLGNISTPTGGWVSAWSAGKLTTSGSIVTGEADLQATKSVTASGVTADSVYLYSSTDSVTFSGTTDIKYGLYAYAGKDISITNSGKVDGMGLYSMGVAGSTTLVNSGEITSGVTIGTDGGLAVGATVTNSGKIDGSLNITALNTIAVTDTAGVAGNVDLHTTNTGGATTINYSGTGDVTFNSLLSSNITVASTGKVTTPFIFDNGAGTGAAKDVSITSSGDTVVLGAGIYNSGKLTISTAKDFELGREIGNASTQPSEINITSGGAITVDGGWGILGGKATLTAAKDLSIGSFINVGTGAISVKSTGGNITQAAALTAGTLTVDAAKAATLTNASNAFTTLNVTSHDAASAVAITNSLATTVKSASTAGAVTLTSGDITLGSTTSDSLVFNGALTLAGVSSSNVTDTAKNIVVGGNLTFGANINNVTLDAAGHNFGTVKGAILGNALITEATALDFGALTVSGNLQAFSTGSDITNSGALKVTGTTQVAAGTSSAPGNITLTNAGNQFGGTITIGLDSGSTAGAANTVAITNSLTTGATDIAASKIVSSLTLIAANDVTDSGVIQVPVASITATGKNVVLDAGTKFNTLTVNSAGGNIVETDDITLNGTQTGSLTLTTNAGSVVLGAISSTGALTVNTQATAGKTITDSAGLLSIYGDTTLNTKGGAITIANGITNGSNFGGVFLNTNNGSTTGANATFTESGVTRFSLVDTGTAGSLTATAGSGILLRDSGNSITTKNLTLTSNSGFIDLKSAASGLTVTGNATYTAGTTITVGLGTTTGNIVAMGGGDVSITNTNAGTYTVSGANVAIAQTGATKLDNVVATGTLGVTSSGKVTQVAGKTILATGAVTVSAAGQDVVLANAGNQFGAVSVTGQNLNIHEDTTLNLKTVTLTGDLTADSSADIVNTGVVTVNTGFVATATGVTTLTAANGSITLNNASNNLQQVVATAKGDVTLVDLGGLQINGGTTVGGKLSVKSSGTINDFGVITVAGQSTFDAPWISILNPNSSYGSLVFKGGNVNFVQNGDVKLAAGSLTTGSVTIESAKGSITSTGASTFQGNLTLISSKDITFIDPSMILGTFTVNAPGTSDLSVLSKAANLNGLTPVNAGTGTVVDPKP
jgi:filamentous hemagglutinin family protein